MTPEKIIEAVERSLKRILDRIDEDPEGVAESDLKQKLNDIISDEEFAEVARVLMRAGCLRRVVISGTVRCLRVRP